MLNIVLKQHGDDLMFNISFNIIHVTMMKGDNGKLYNEAPYSHEVNYTSSRIWTRDLMIWSQEH